MKTGLLVHGCVLLLLAGCATPGVPPGAHSLVGTYRLLSFQAVPDGEAAIDIWGRQPTGYITITPRRFMAVLTAENRRLPAGPTPTPQDLVASFVTQSAYTGPYRIEGNRIITTVDASSYATWKGTEQIREFRLEGSRLHLSTLPGPLLVPAGKAGRMHLLWERLE
ncbi:MAG: lipocalin-like domain-containing protein [Burkholderiales bacterium]|nr:lipocalin-like domain-containing protein [Burkholderiales bacterium]